MSLLAPSMLASPFQLLEINIISAQDLPLVSKSIKAYAVAWLNPERKLTTQADPHGHNNPTWNEKFVFRVEDDFLQCEDSVIMVELYASAWLRDVLIGTVAIHVNNILPRSGNRKSKIRFVALQVRRPSGRPQGILNIGVNLVDATMRSMPMYSELSASDIEYDDIRNPKKHTQTEKGNYDSNMMTLQRSQSEKNDSTINDYTYNPDGKNGYYDESESEIGVPTGKKGVIVNANGSLCSDVGPSPSVVAAAIAKGLYPLPMQMTRRTVNQSPMFEKWPPEKQHGGEMLNTRMDNRWRAIELPGAYDNNNNNNNGEKDVVKQTGKGKNGRKGDGLFSCFGTVLGCEISITCGGGNRKKRHEGKKSRGATVSELTYESSYV
ncbi:hypothetical protein L195_g038684 [Trifolium pratense]|uniref:C2 domain-containing protein n=1 Tax=Trifolium pratense TaxID=57577 RepID=A0A2K3LVW0_TRIPR|nr:hypothetical protein L195_g038684 [Trifolium pratense]